jgi:lipopolysaccharide transport system permease protein
MYFKDREGNIVTIYSSNERQGIIIWALKQAWSDILLSREAIVRLFLRDFVAQFRQRILGYLWAILVPLFSIASFIFLYYSGILNPGVQNIPYPIYIFLGTSIWGCLSGTIGSISGGLIAQADLIMRTNIPKLALALSSLASILYGILVNMVILAILFLIYGFTPSWYFALYPILILPMLILGTSLGLVISVVGSIARDISQIITQGIALLMYVTPIIYMPASISSPLIRKIITLNPLSYLIDVPRTLIFYGSSESFDIYFYTSLGTLIVAIIMLRIFYLLQDLVAERL